LPDEVKPAKSRFPTATAVKVTGRGGTVSANRLAANDLNRCLRGIISLSFDVRRYQSWWFMVRSAAHLRNILTALMTLGVAASPLFAQTVSPAGTTPSPRREYESRSELEAQAKAAEAAHRTNEAWLLHQRLEKGDFQDGDKIALTVQASLMAGPLDVPETLTVRAGRRVELGRMGEISLEGELRSELTDKLRDHLAEYVKEPIVRTTPLVRVGVLGFVGRPGFFYSPADRPLSDVLMLAGGPGQDSNISGVTVRRGDDVIWTAQDTHTAIADGLSLDRMHLRAGDEIYVPQKRHIQWLGLASFAISLIGAAAYLFSR
jgi:protein involved in polysaccharide export with SLBB domain